MFKDTIEFVSIEILIGNDWIEFVSTYIHPYSPYSNEFEKFLSSGKRFIIGGDLNGRHVDFGDASTNSWGNWIRALCDTNLLTLLNPSIPTIVKSDHGSYIDKFILSGNFPFTYGNIEVIPSFSDHSAIMLTCHANVNEPSGTVKTVKMFNFTKVKDMNRFLESELSKIDLPSDVNVSNRQLDDIADRIRLLFRQAVDTFVPNKHKIN